MEESKHFFDSLKALVRNSNHPWPKKTKGHAPHKPLLLLSVLDGIDQGWIDNRNITLSQNLKDAFNIYWDAIIGKDNDTDVSTPFKHLAGQPFDPFWEYLGGKRARLNEDLFNKLKDKSFRTKVRQILMQEYFSPKGAVILSDLSEVSSEAWKYAISLDQMTIEEFSAYHNKKETLQKKSQQVRETGFSLKVRDLYDNSCAICKSRVVTPFGRTLVEGAHIIPWSESYNDDPRNGLSLCRNHHWLFDRYLIALREDYTIEVSSYLQENNEQAFHIESIMDKEIALPKEASYYPALEAIRDHRSRYSRYYLD